MCINRKRLLAVAAVVLVCGGLGTTAWAVFGQVRNEGVGIYTDASVMFQPSTFTINREIVSCGVGVAEVTVLNGGPFDMLMYSTSFDSYAVNHATGIITATGTMRSITTIAGVEIEDVEHDFLAIAEDNGADGAGDAFNVHFTTAFWNANTLLGIPLNPMCTASDEVEGGCRFGGELLRGDVTVE